MNEIPRISEAEWEVMKVLWSKPNSTANDVVKALGDKMKWKPKTIKTLISRLVKKQVLDFNQEGRVYYYYPLVYGSECVTAETKSFLDRIYGGAFKPMLVHFLKEEKLSNQEIEELKKILDERRE